MVGLPLTIPASDPILPLASLLENATPPPPFQPLPFQPNPNHGLGNEDAVNPVHL